MEAAEEEKGREGSVGRGCIFEFHIPDVRYIAFFVFCLETDILKSHKNIFWAVAGKIGQ